MDTKDKLIGKLKEAGNLLNSAKCPDCNGSGIILSQTVKTGTKWIDDGHGNPLPEPYPIINHDQSPCFWCYYKDNLLLEITALEKQIKEKKPIEDKSAEIIFNDGMDDEEQESKSEKQVTDKMIEKWAKDVNQRNFSYSFYDGLIKGAKWMKDKLKTK